MLSLRHGNEFNAVLNLICTTADGNKYVNS